MIEKFNFYDIYGYLLPGLAFLTLLWLPFGIFEHVWPASQISSAIAALGFAYIVGNLLQTLAGQSIPSRFKDTNGLVRYPSNFVLDASDHTFSTDFKKLIGDRAKHKLNIDVSIGDPDEKVRSETDRRRREAFFLARGVLIKEGLAKYTEQFEGMYSLMRGLAAAFALGSIYITGWAASLFENKCFQILAASVGATGMLGSIVITLVVLLRRWETEKQKEMATILERLVSLGVALALLAFGYFSGIMHIGSGSLAALCVFFALAVFFAALRFYGFYRYFAQEFAKAVWRDYVGRV